MKKKKKLTKHISCDQKYKFVGRKYNLNENWENNVSVDVSVKFQQRIKKAKNIKNIMFGILVHVIVRLLNI